MADLSTLDATQPAGSDPVSAGDDAIRATRDATKTSFGGTDSGSGTQTSEHYLKGMHKFPTGNTAARPTAGNSGRLYINTETTQIERDTGAAWAQANAAQVAIGTCSSFVSLTTSYQDVPGMSATVVISSGGRLVVSGAVLASSTATGRTLYARILVAGVSVCERAISSPGGMIPLDFAVAAPGTGSTVVKVQAKIDVVSGTSLAGTSGSDQVIAQVL